MNDTDPVLDADELSTVLHPKSTGPIEAIAFDLEVVEGPDLGKRFTIDAASAARLLVGQSPACDVRLADRAVSRRHAALELSERGLRLTDLGSTNGTFIGSLPIVQLFLQGGEVVRMGSTTFRVTARAAAAPPSAPGRRGFGRLVGLSREMQRLYLVCARLAQSMVPVLIEGETGTGKEVLAESLHECGPRAGGPFVVFDCTAVAPSLVESELFGHERGAFTGAVAARKGVFEQAEGGTLLIDEIGDLELPLQAKFLRAIERAQVRRVGGDRSVDVDVRILAATRRDLDREVLTGRFRDDLFHRLAVARVELPPLRRRRGDIPFLVQHFSAALGAGPEELAGIQRQFRHREEDPWPGNVRELRNAVARQLALGDLVALEASPNDGELLNEEPSGDPAARADAIERVLSKKLPFGRARAQVLEAFRQRYIEQVLADHDGNIARAAEASGVGRRYFQRIKARRTRR